MKRSTDPRDFETHYFFDARMSVPAPSGYKSHSKSEEGARRACVVRIDAEQYNKAVIIYKPTNKVLQVYRRDPKTGNIYRKNHLYQEWLNEEMEA